MDAVHDGATLQILYEGRTADTALTDKHSFDTKFEDLFRHRTDEEIAAIKKKYGATGDILEAEKRIAAIARDLVDHYIDNIFPDGFKAQVVCHSKLAAIRYQKAIRDALAERLERQKLKAKPDAGLIRRIAFLKAVVVVSSDATNEIAIITEARKEAKRWNVVENFCKPFDLDDPDKHLTGIAFLIVCDMLLTGFDAPVEQVMYIDKRRADFEVYLKKFLQSLNLILPHESGHQYRGPARRFGYLLRMVKERCKDDSLDITDAGAKVKALINEHLIDLGINPKIPPVELLSPDFMAHVNKHAGGDSEAKASEMEHAIRKHCTVHFEEDPAFYKKLSEKLENLILQYKDNWDALAEGYEQIRLEAEAGRSDVIEGLTKETTTFYDYVCQLAFDGGEVPAEHRKRLKQLMSRIVEVLQETIGIIDFWGKPVEVKKLRANIATAKGFFTLDEATACCSLLIRTSHCF